MSDLTRFCISENDPNFGLCKKTKSSLEMVVFSVARLELEGYNNFRFLAYNPAERMQCQNHIPHGKDNE